MIIDEKTYNRMPKKLQYMFNKLPNPGSDEVLAEFAKAGESGSNRGPTPANNEPSEADSKVYGWAEYPQMHKSGAHFGDTGTAARFFYCAKASRAERNAGLDGMEEKEVPYSEYRENYKDTKDYVTHYPDGSLRPVNPTKNSHPCVKPLKLMRYLARLTRTPTGGVILDPFMGSGTTGMAAVMEGRPFIGIELDEQYYAIAQARIADAQRQPPLFV